MRIVFIGCVAFSRTMLLKTLALNANVVGLVTKKQSSINSDFEDLSFIAKNHSISYKYVNDINHPNNIRWIVEKRPDVIFCFGWSNLIKSDVLNASPLGVVGYHPSLLPYNRGRHPIIWAKALGLKSTGSTFFFMDEGADTGDILSQLEIPIHFEDNALDIYNRLTKVAQQQLSEFLPLLQDGTYLRKPQDLAAGNSWRKRTAPDGFIDFRMATSSICNLVRALSHPYPGAHCNYRGTEYKIWAVEPGSFSGDNIEPGKVLNIEENIIEVKSGNGSVRLIQHSFPNLPEIGSYF